MTAWVLYVCIGASSWGCGSVRLIDFPNEDACYKALAAIRTGDQPIAESSAKRNTVALCAPKGSLK